VPALRTLCTTQRQQYVRENTAAGYPMPRIRDGECAGLVAAIQGDGCKYISTILAEVQRRYPAGQYTTDEYMDIIFDTIYGAVPGGWYNQQYQHLIHAQGKYYGTAKEGMLGAWCSGMHTLGVRAGLTEAQIANIMRDKIVNSADLDRFDSAVTRNGPNSLLAAIQDLKTRDKSVISHVATAVGLPANLFDNTGASRGNQARGNSSINAINSGNNGNTGGAVTGRKDGCPRHGGPKASHSAAECRSAANNNGNARNTGNTGGGNNGNGRTSGNGRRPKPYQRTSGGDKPDKSSVTCFECNQSGHIKKDCPYAADIEAFRRKLTSAGASSINAISFGDGVQVPFDPTRVTMPPTRESVAARQAIVADMLNSSPAQQAPITMMSAPLPQQFLADTGAEFSHSLTDQMALLTTTAVTQSNEALVDPIDDVSLDAEIEMLERELGSTSEGHEVWHDACSDTHDDEVGDIMHE